MSKENALIKRDINISKRLTWEEIKRKYPHQNVGLVDVEMAPNKVVVKSAVVKYTDKNTDYNEMAYLALQGKLTLRYTTLDEELVLMPTLTEP